MQKLQAKDRSNVMLKKRVNELNAIIHDIAVIHETEGYGNYRRVKETIDLIDERWKL